MGKIKAGIKRVIISPDKGLYLTGYAGRKGGNRGILDDLTCTTLFLDDGRNKILLIALDLLGLNREIVCRIRNGIEKETGIPGNNIIVSCSHTHSGPIGWAPERITVIDKLKELLNRVLLLPQGFNQSNGVVSEMQFFNTLTQRIIKSSSDAVKNCENGELFHGRNSVSIGINRREKKEDGTIDIGRNPDGPVDAAVDIIQIYINGNVILTLVNYACHCVVLGPENNLVSADYAGFMREKVEKELGGLCMFIQGACGDINPVPDHNKRNNKDIENVGGSLADAVIACANNMKRITAIPVKAVENTVYIKMNIPEGLEKLAINKIYKTRLNRIYGFPKLLVDPLLSSRFPWKTEIVQDADGYSTPVYISAVRIGDLVIASVSMEPFVKTGLSVKEESAAPITLFTGYTNGLTGYLPTKEAVIEGGFEVEVSPWFYRLPGIFKADSEELVRIQMLKIIDSLYI